MKEINQLYIAKVVFKNLLEEQKHVLYTYCFEASNSKEAYQQALISASEKYFHLNENGSFNFVGLQELTPLIKIGLLTKVKNLSHTVTHIDESALKQHQDKIEYNLSVA